MCKHPRHGTCSFRLVELVVTEVTLEKEAVTLVIDKEAKTYQIEGWEAVAPALLEKTMRRARTLAHGELKALLIITLLV